MSDSSELRTLQREVSEIKAMLVKISNALSSAGLVLDGRPHAAQPPPYTGQTCLPDDRRLTPHELAEAVANGNHELYRQEMRRRREAMKRKAKGIYKS